MAEESTEATEGTETDAPPAEAAQATTGEVVVNSTNTNGAAADGAQAGTETASEEPQTSWRDLLPDEYQKEAAQFNTIEGVFKHRRELRKQMQQMVTLPGEKATEEQVAAYRKKVGIPEAADGYGIEAPEWFDDKGRENFADFLTKAHAANMTPAQVAGAVEAYAGYEQARAEETIKKDQADREAWETALKEKWGPDFERNTAVAERAVQFFGTPELAKMLKSMKLEGGGYVVNHPAFSELMANVGEASSEPTGAFMPSYGSEESKAALMSQLEEYEQGKHGDYWSKPVQDKVQAIHAKLHGNQYHSGPSSSRAVS